MGGREALQVKKKQVGLTRKNVRDIKGMVKRCFRLKEYAMKTKTHLTSGLLSELLTTTMNVSRYENGTSVVYTSQVTQVSSTAVPISIPAPTVLVFRPYQLLWAALVTVRW
jgi:hypothetical protein